MNILPKKRWHVRNKDNVARVRKDIENAKREEQEREKRRNDSTREISISHLRKQANIDGLSMSAVVPVQNDSSSLVNKSNADNPEYAKELKLEQEKYEKKIGYLTYVGQSLLDSQKDEKLWYLKESSSSSTSKSDKKDEARKEKLDPLYQIKKHKKKPKEHFKEKKKSKKSIEELRAQRLKREHQERKKANLLMGNG